MNTIRHLLIVLLISALAVALSSCSGSTQVAGGGTGGTGISMGTVTGFGSVFVNGVEYFTEQSTTISLDGVDYPEDQHTSTLALGMVVKVTASSNNGVWTASAIEYRSELKGPVENLNATTKTFEVLGKTVMVTADTWFEGGIAFTSISAMANNQFVTVTGFRNEAGHITATRISWDGTTTWDGSSPISVVRRGIVYLPGAGDFHLDSDAGIRVVTDSVPGAGAHVHVEGTYNGTEITDATVEIEETTFGAEGDEFEMEGIVTSTVPLVVNGYTIDVAEVEGGVTGIAIGDRVEVEGSISNGVIVAEEIEVKHESQMEFLAQVQAKNTSANPPFITMDGLDFQITAATAVEDKSTFLQDVTVGQWVNVHAYPTGPSTFVVTEAEVEGAGPRKLEGAVQSVGASTFTIGGITVATDGSTTYDAAIGGFGGITVDRELEVVLRGSTFMADTIGPED